VARIYPCLVVSNERPVQRLWSTPRSALQMRTLNAALKLFAECGVGTTSYQMIADAVGVTKAAIYHQFKTKDEIIVAVAEMELAKLQDALDAAEAEERRDRGRELLLHRVVDHAVEHRRAASMLLFDPAIVRTLSNHEPIRRVVERLHRVIVGDDSGADAQVRLAALTCVVGGTVAHPLVAEVDDETLRTQLLNVVRQLAGLPAATDRPTSGQQATK
jgi:AcrR family transcriptional regulator